MQWSGARKTPLRLRLQTLLAHEIYKVTHTAAIAPLVVVPRNDFHAVPGNDARHWRVNDRRTRVAAEIGRDEFVLFISEISRKWSVLAGCLQRPVHFFDGGLLFYKDDKVHNGYVRSRNAHRETVELSFEFRDGEIDGFCCAGRSRDHIDCCGTSATQ